MSSRTQMGYVEQPPATYVQQQQQDGGGGVVPVSVNGVSGVMPVGMPVQQQQAGGVPQQQQQQQQGGAPPAVAVITGITRVYVGNLSWETEWQDLKDHMRTAGEVSQGARCGGGGWGSEWGSTQSYASTQHMMGAD